MTSEQALMVLKQALVVRPNMTLDEIATVIQAWNVIAEAIKPKVNNDNSR